MATNLYWSKAQSQLDLSLSQFSPSLFIQFIQFIMGYMSFPFQGQCSTDSFLSMHFNKSISLFPVFAGIKLYMIRLNQIMDYFINKFHDTVACGSVHTHYNLLTRLISIVSKPIKNVVFVFVVVIFVQKTLVPQNVWSKKI